MSQQQPTFWERHNPKIAPFVAGAIVITVLGFSAFGWTRGGTAEKMAADRAEEVAKAFAVNILPPLCAAQAKADADGGVKLAAYTALTDEYDRIKKIRESDWVKFAGIKELSFSNTRTVAEACAKILFGPKPA